MPSVKMYSLSEAFPAAASELASVQGKNNHPHSAARRRLVDTAPRRITLKTAVVYTLRASGFGSNAREPCVDESPTRRYKPTVRTW